MKQLCLDSERCATSCVAFLIIFPRHRSVTPSRINTIFKGVLKSGRKILDQSSISLSWVRERFLKYLTVLTLSSSVASSSHMKMLLGCNWNADTVHMWFTPSSMALCNANALWAPVMRIMTSRASITVATPTVRASVGTLDKSSPKNRALARMVSWASVLTLVLLARDDPGSLNAMWPSGPIPPMNNSIPPAFLIFSSKLLHSVTKSSALPSKIWALTGLMSMCLKKLLYINEW